MKGTETDAAERGHRSQGVGGRRVRMDELEAARECVLAVGVSRTTFSDVARRAGVSRMTLYKRYPDLESLLQALIGHEFGSMILQVHEEVAGIENARERFIEAVARVGERFIDNDIFLRMLEVDADLLMPYVTERLGGSQLEAVNVLEQIARDGQRDGSIRDGDPHVFAAMAESVGRPLVMMARAQIRAIPQEVAFAELRVMLDAYLRP